MLHIETPQLESRALGSDGRSIWLKMEALQPSGSFKIRGIGFACQQYKKRGARRFVSSSGGNAGLAVAYAGRRLDVPVLVVVPETTTERAKTLIRSEGAEVVVRGKSWNEAHSHALSLVGKKDAFLHPFEDVLIWKGHSTLIDEIKKSGIKPDAIVLSVGGGGLLCGVVQGLQKNGWKKVPVIAVETLGADSFAQALRAGKLVELPGIASLATSLGARKVSEQALKWSQKHPITSAVVSDKSAIAACVKLLRDHRVLTEPACGASLSLVYEDSSVLKEFKNILVIVCGGVGVTVEQLTEWERRLETV